MKILRDVFGEIVIPQEVYDEVTTGTHPAVELVKSATWIEIRAVMDTQKVSALQNANELDLGEFAAMGKSEN